MNGKPEISFAQAAQYFALRDAAAARVAAYDLSEESYRAMFEAGLEPLDEFLATQGGASFGTNDPQRDAFEKNFATYAAVLTGRNDAFTGMEALLQQAQDTDSRLRGDVFAALKRGGAQIQDVLGALVLTDKGAPETGSGNGLDAPRFAPKFNEVISALLGAGLFADDLFIYRGLTPRGAMRIAPYMLIDIPRLDRQIAVCDQIGETTLVLRDRLSVQQWASSSKKQLTTLPEMITLSYSSKHSWIEPLPGLLLGDVTGKVVALPPKQPIAPSNGKPFITLSQLAQWIKFYHEKTGKWPAQASKEIWEKNEDSQWQIVPGLIWKHLDGWMRYGFRGLPRGSSLLQFRTEQGLCDPPGITAVSEAELLEWIRAYREKTGEWPSISNKDVWHKDAAGQWHITPKVNWSQVDSWLRIGIWGLEGGSTLAQLRQKNGLCDPYEFGTISEAQVMLWTKLYHEKTEEWPKQVSKDVWQKDEAGQWQIMPGLNWSQIHLWFNQGLRGFPGGYTLSDLRQKNGLCDPYEFGQVSENKIISWMRQFEEKTGKWPKQSDKEVWEKDEEGKWRAIPRLNWSALELWLRQGMRGLPGGSTVSQLRKRHFGEAAPRGRRTSTSAEIADPS